MDVQLCFQYLIAISVNLHDRLPCIIQQDVIGIETKIEVIVTSQKHAEGCAEIHGSLRRPQLPKSRYQFLFYRGNKE